MRFTLPFALGFSLFSSFAHAQSCTPPDVTITFDGSSNDGYVCGGLSVTASVPDAGPGATYTWSLSSPTLASITSGGGTRSITLQTKNLFLANPTFGINVTVTSGCGSNSSQRPLTAIQLVENYSVDVTPTRTVIGVGPIGCTTATYTATLTSTLDAPPERTYQWEISGGQLLSGQGTKQIAFSRASPGTLGWSVVQQDRCSSLAYYVGRSGSWQQVRPIEQSPQVVAPAFVGSYSTGNAAYLGGWQELLLNGPRVSSLVWSVAGGTFSTPDEAYGAMPAVFTAGASGSVTITAAVSDYCGHTYMPSAMIPIMQAPLSISSADRICSDGQAEASVADIACASYEWTIDGGMITSGQGTSRINFIPSATAVSLTVNVGSISATKSVEVVQAPDATIIADSFVQPHSIEHASVGHAGPQATYSWRIVNGTIRNSSTAREITYVPSGDGPVQLYVVVTSNGGCQSSSSTMIAVQCPQPTVPQNLQIEYLGQKSGCSQANDVPCSLGEAVLFSVLSQGQTLGDCNDVHWTIGPSDVHAAWAEQQLDAGVHAVNVTVQNEQGTASAHATVMVGGARHRPSRH